MHKFLLVAAIVGLTGCAKPGVGLYNWGSYEQNLYAAYKDPTQTENLRIKLEEYVAANEKSGMKVAPGLYAELGTLYLQGGASDKAIAMYTKERDLWPESKGLMTAMIKNIERRQQAAKQQADNK